MLNVRQVKLLELLEGQISECHECDLYPGGQCLPYWTPLSEYVIVGEAPGRDEVNNDPFCGRAGQHLWRIAREVGLVKSQFAIINSVNCRPINASGGNGKPSTEQQEICRKWMRKFIRVVDPEKVLVLGNYAMKTLIGKDKGILSLNSSTWTCVEFNNVLLLSIHPAMCMYDGKNGQVMLKKSLEAFIRLEY